MQKTKSQGKRKFVEPTLRKEATLVELTKGCKLISGGQQTSDCDPV